MPPLCRMCDGAHRVLWVIQPGLECSGGLVGRKPLLSFNHPADSAKMRAGQPLTDEDRVPWLAALAFAIQKHASRCRGFAYLASPQSSRNDACASGDDS